MSHENTTLSPVAVELIGNVSGTYAAPFWDGLREVTGTLNTIRKIKTVLEALYTTDNEIEAYHFILALYDGIAIETSPAISELAPYPDAIEQFIIQFLLDIEDLMDDFEYEEQESENA